ncbi:UNVERIFIED_CONTAM: Chitinase 2 [Sesamum latifolium]|uniref:Chitinase 2 n=1 Tax=Sesamum latifolium TaxID=2727402 RepID=A0AAW2Y4Q1_9LAMI
MDFSKHLSIAIALLIFQVLVVLFPSSAQSASNNSNLFREYIGAEFKNVKFSNLPINSQVEFHFILSFAIDYTTSSSATPTDGNFNVFWTPTISPQLKSQP